MNDLDPTNSFKIRKPELRIRKPRRSDIKRSNPCGDQITQFTGYTKRFNVKNSYCNHKKKEPDLTQSLLYAYHPPTKGKHKQGGLLL
jgi:hypothetical protein